MASLLSGSSRVTVPVMVSIFLLGLVVRVLVGLWGYSGAGTPPMFGDFEAQRHWMEVTTALPMGDWYFNTTDNNLQYWGLDYPPLTAYVSYGFGRIAQSLAPALVELHTSRGHESDAGKAFMRGTVLLSDVIVFFPALVLAMNAGGKHTKGKGGGKLLLLAVLAPALILIDHGHFQYNGISIGLTLAAAAAILGEHNCVGSVLFSLSLNFKQMSLYHAPVFFAILLRKCILRGFSRKPASSRLIPSSNEFSSYRVMPFVLYLSAIGGTVIAIFAVLWLPLCVAASSSAEHTCGAVIVQVVSRIFPFSRGIFEDKVANLWYLTSVLYDYRTVVAQTLLVRGSLVVTLMLLLPVLYSLGKRDVTAVRFLLGLVVSALAFFLAAFQVHEKSLLLALVPASLLVLHRPLDVGWFQVTGCMTLYPLLVRDGQAAPYWACCFLYLGLLCLYGLPSAGEASVEVVPRKPSRSAVEYCFLLLRKLYFCISIPGVVVLHVAEAHFPAPSHLPDLYPALFALFGCCSLLWNYVFFVHWLMEEDVDGDGGDGHGLDRGGSVQNKGKQE